MPFYLAQFRVRHFCALESSLSLKGESISILIQFATLQMRWQAMQFNWSYRTSPFLVVNCIVVVACAPDHKWTSSYRSATFLFAIFCANSKELWENLNVSIMLHLWTASSCVALKCRRNKRLVVTVEEAISLFLRLKTSINQPAPRYVIRWIGSIDLRKKAKNKSCIRRPRCNIK